ncbi:MAG: hypothetical protein ABIS23_00905 [Sphingomicrobium sp.]
MKLSLAFLPFALIVAAPAAATQGMICSGKGASISMLFGHVAVPTLINAELMVADAVVPSAIARSWAGDNETWVDLADPDQMALIASLRLTYAKRAWRGTLTHKGRKIAVRCEEA